MVSDNGIGIPKYVDFHKPKTLGLQLIHDIVEQIGGTIDLNRHNGTKFTITFEKPEIK